MVKEPRHPNSVLLWDAIACGVLLQTAKAFQPNVELSDLVLKTSTAVEDCFTEGAIPIENPKPIPVRDVGHDEELGRVLAVE